MFSKAQLPRFNDKKDSNTSLKNRKTTHKSAVTVAKKTSALGQRTSAAFNSKLKNNPATGKTQKVKQNEELSSTGKHPTNSNILESEGMLDVVGSDFKSCAVEIDGYKPTLMAEGCQKLVGNEGRIPETSSNYLLANVSKQDNPGKVLNSHSTESEYKQSEETVKEKVSEKSLSNLNVKTSVSNITTISDMSHSDKQNKKIQNKIKKTSSHQHTPKPIKTMQRKAPVSSDLTTKKSTIVKISKTDIIQLENDYNSKTKRFSVLQREFENKQKNILESYNALVSLREKLCSYGKNVPVLQIKNFQFLDFGVVLTSLKKRQLSESVCLVPCPFEGGGEDLSPVLTEINCDSIELLKKGLHSVSFEPLNLLIDSHVKMIIFLSWIENHSKNEEELKDLENLKEMANEIFTRMEYVKTNQNKNVFVIVNAVEKLWKDHEEIKNSNDLLELKCKNLTSEIENISYERDFLKKSNSDFKIEINSKESVIREMDDERKTIEAENNLLRKQLNESVAVNSELSKENEEKDFAYREILIKQQTQQIEFQNKENEHNSKMKELREEYDKSKRTIETLEGEVSKYKESLTLEQNKVINMDREKNILHLKVEDISEKLANEENKKKHLEMKLNDATENIKNMIEKCSNLECFLEKHKEESIQKEAEYNKCVKSCKTKVETLEVLLKAEKAKFEALEKEKEEFINRTKQRIEQIADESEDHTYLKMGLQLLEKDDEIFKLRMQIKEIQINSQMSIMRTQLYENMDEQLKIAENHIYEVDKMEDHSTDEQTAEKQIDVNVLYRQIHDLEYALYHLINQKEVANNELCHKKLETEQLQSTMKRMIDMLKVRGALVNLHKSKEGQLESEIQTLKGNNERECCLQEKESEKLRNIIKIKYHEVLRLKNTIKQMELKYIKSEAKCVKYENHIAHLEHRIKGNHKKYYSDDSPQQNFTSKIITYPNKCYSDESKCTNKLFRHKSNENLPAVEGTVKSAYPITNSGSVYSGNRITSQQQMGIVPFHDINKHKEKRMSFIVKPDMLYGPLNYNVYLPNGDTVSRAKKTLAENRDLICTLRNEKRSSSGNEVLQNPYYNQSEVTTKEKLLHTEIPFSRASVIPESYPKIILKKIYKCPSNKKSITDSEKATKLKTKQNFFNPKHLAL